MAPDNKQEDTNAAPQKKWGAGQLIRRQTALAFELPFTIVGALVVGGVVGYFLDQAFHTKMIFTVILGVLGFAGGVVEVIRRLP